MDYEMIKQLAKEMGCKVTDLIPLAPQNDPFYTGTPSDWALAEWFAHLSRAFSYQDKVHIRRVHYQIVSQRTPVLLPNGKPYGTRGNIGIRSTWLLRRIATCNSLTLPHSLIGAMMTRWSMHLSREAFAQMRVYGNLWRSSLELPDFPGVPAYGTSGFQEINGPTLRCGVKSPP